MSENGRLRNRRLRLESLEDRTLLAVFAGWASGGPEPAAEISDVAEFAEAVEFAEAAETASIPATTWIVNTAADVAANDWEIGDHIVSLREAIERSSAGETILFDPSIDWTLETNKIILTNGELTISRSIQIDASANMTAGSGAPAVMISGNNASRVFCVTQELENLSVELIGLALLDGKTNSGGGIFNSYGTLTLTRCAVTANRAGDGGAGIYNDSGTLTLTGCSITGNSADYYGGGIYNSYGTLTVTDCAISENSSLYGGGIYHENGRFTLTDSAVFGNLSLFGGGIYNDGTATVTGCAITGNSVSDEIESYGGGIFNDGNLTLTCCTIADNSVSGEYSSGGGICNNGAVTLYNSIVALNKDSFSDNDIFASGSISGFNILSGFTAWDSSKWCYVYDASRPLFADAGDGVYPLAAGSQAIERGNNSYAVRPDGSAIEFDLAGMERIVHGVIDLGAFEFQGAAPAEPLSAPASGSVVSAGANRHGVSWSGVENGVGYELAYSTDQTNWSSISTPSVSSVVTGLTYGSTVYYRVKALGDGENYADSEWSAAVNLTVCPMDVNGDGRINASDKNSLSASWNKRTSAPDSDPRCDVNGDGRINASDNNFLSSNWNKRTAAADLTYPVPLAETAAPNPAAIDAVLDEMFIVQPQLGGK